MAAGGSLLDAQALGNIARSGNVSELARKVGMSSEGLCKALSEGGNPSFANIVKIRPNTVRGFESLIATKLGESYARWRVSRGQ